MELQSDLELWKDVDATTHQLMINAAALEKALSLPELFPELGALQKTQESLLARLSHRHYLLQQEPKKRKSGLSSSSRRRAFKKRLET